MAETTAKTAKKPPEAHDSHPAEKGGEGEQTSALDRAADLSEEVLESVATGQRSAIEAVRKFVDALDKALPAIGDRSRREAIIKAAVDMTDRLVTTQLDFLRSVVKGADRWLREAEAANESEEANKTK